MSETKAEYNVKQVCAWKVKTLYILTGCHVQLPWTETIPKTCPECGRRVEVTK